MQVVIERTESEPLAQGGVLCAGSAPTRTAELKRFRGGERRTGSEATRRTASRTWLRSTCAGRCRARRRTRAGADGTGTVTTAEVIGYLRKHEGTLTWNPAAAALQARDPQTAKIVTVKTI
jgi:hypothetical protein